MANRRALHFVLKIGNRKESIHFYRDILGMKILRHEEFEEGCKATCNGPYDGKWSKTMIGYGPEDTNFVLELTYNYGISSYNRGNEFQSITIGSSPGNPKVSKASILEKVPQSGSGGIGADGALVIKSPCGYTFRIKDLAKSIGTSPVLTHVTLSCTNLATSTNYWKELLGMNEYENELSKSITLGYEQNQTKLTLLKIDEPLDRGTGFGRLAFSCPSNQLPEIEGLMKSHNQSILTPLVSLDTPGKATVQVVILGDPDGHEICFVGDEGFRDLSQVDPKAGELLERAMDADKSDEWFMKHGKEKSIG